VTRLNLQVLSMAVNSGLVTFPIGYKKVGYAQGLAIWAPLPPEGYLSLGHVASSGEDDPPTNQVQFPPLQCEWGGL
jgi:hypothetical protein